MTSTMPAVRWPASARYSDSFAPGGLGFVEDFLNTAPAGRPLLPDLLADHGSAQEWLDGALATLGQQGTSLPADALLLSEHDLRDLRLFREDLHTGLRAAARDKAAGDGRSMDDADAETVARGIAGLALDERARVRVEAQGQGADLVRSYVLVQLAVAEFEGRRDRLKVCANEDCRTAFFDQSKNVSRTWHDVKTCGNTANLRSHRQRLKSQAANLR